MISTDQKIIVTGGAGFIGSNLIKGLNNAGYSNITVVDELDASPKWQNLLGLKFEKYMDKQDFLTAILEKRPTIKPRAIFHIGACADTQMNDMNFLMSNNALYSKAIFDYCAEEQINLIYASSAAVYGDGSRGYQESLKNLSPLNPYGYSKYIFDEWVLNSGKKPPQWVGLRFFNVYGNGEAHKGRMASVIYHGYYQAIKTGAIKLFKSYRPEYPDGGQQRDFVYIKDVVKVSLFFLNHPDKIGIFNIGTGVCRTFLDLANSVFAALRKEPRIDFIEMPEGLAEKYQYSTQADISSLRETGYSEEFFSLEAGVQDYVSNYLSEKTNSR